MGASPVTFGKVTMHIATVVLSVLLAAEFVFAGISEILNTGTTSDNAAHLDLSLRLSRLRGIAEIATAVGLLAGIAVKPLAIMTAAAVCLLMAGALGYHPKARDEGAVLLPVAITGLAAIALLRLTVAA
jgi:uncharacterized membrane protein YphA (DoxX/SURF4 family)